MKKLVATVALLTLISCAWAEPVKKLDVIADKEWQLDPQEFKLPAGAKVTLRIAKDGKVDGRAPVNSYGGIITLDGQGGCSWGAELIATLMAGPPEMMNAEKKYFDALPKTKKVDFSNGVLTFSSRDGKMTLVFRHAQATKQK